MSVTSIILLIILTETLSIIGIPILLNHLKNN